jgi:uncharacterized protein
LLSRCASHFDVLAAAYAHTHAAAQPLAKDDVLIVFAGRTVTKQQLLELGPSAQRFTLQVHENLWQIPMDPERPDAEMTDHILHSCSPNCGMEDSVTVVAMRDIAEGELLTIDYGSVQNGNNALSSDNFECECGAPNCRRSVTQDDWKLPSVWASCWPYFPPFVKSSILKLNGGDAPISN